MPHWIPEVDTLLDQAYVVMPGVNNHWHQSPSQSRSSSYLQELGSGKALQFLADLESRLNTGHRNSSVGRGPGVRSLSSTSGLGIEMVGRGPDLRKHDDYIQPIEKKMMFRERELSCDKYRKYI